MRKGLMGLTWLATVLAGCATSAPTVESKDRAGCEQYAHRFVDHRGRMKDACLISRGHRQTYSTVLGDLWVRSTVDPRQPAETVAADLKACNDAINRWSNEGWVQFSNCMTPRGYAVSVY